MTIKKWFCRSALGPGPSNGGPGTVANGCAGPASRKLKKAPHASQTPTAYGMYSGCLSRFCRVATATYTPITRPQKRIDPSSDDQRLTIETQVGTDREPTWATELTLKSWLRSAYSITTLARAMKAA